MFRNKPLLLSQPSAEWAKGTDWGWNVITCFRVSGIERPDEDGSGLAVDEWELISLNETYYPVGVPRIETGDKRARTVLEKQQVPQVICVFLSVKLQLYLYL